MRAWDEYIEHWERGRDVISRIREAIRTILGGTRCQIDVVRDRVVIDEWSDVPEEVHERVRQALGDMGVPRTHVVFERMIPPVVSCQESIIGIVTWPPPMIGTVIGPGDMKTA